MFILVPKFQSGKTHLMNNGTILLKTWQYRLKSGFLRRFFLSIFLVICLSHSLAAFSSQLNQEIRGVWLTTHDTDTLMDRPKLQEAIAQLAELNFNTLYPVVWNSGYALYPSQVAQQAGIQPFVRRGLQGQDPLADLIAHAHQQGLLVIPWFEFGFMAPPTSELALNYPNWLTQKQDGSQTGNSAAGEVVWLNPFHREVQQLITALVLEVMEQYDVDGIQFDDHLSLPAEFGYDPYTVNLYQQETEQAPPNNPQDEAWMRWRANKLTDFVKSLNEKIKEKKTKAIFSLSPNPYETAYKSYLQDWPTWVQENLVDELIVQVYRLDLSSFVQQVTRPEIQAAQQKIPTAIGILAGVRHRPIEIEFIQDKVIAARQNGLGVSFFFYDSLWHNAPEPPLERKSSFQSLFPQPAIRRLNNKQI